MKSFLAEAKKKTDAIEGAREKIFSQLAEQKGMSGAGGEHRVFVSTTLVYLPKNPEPVQPLNRNMKTEDGLEVGWKMKFGFDPADPSVQGADPDGDGFTNQEEYLAGTDPTRKEDSPAKESKLKSRSGEPVAMTVSFPEKSGGLFTIRFQVGAKRREFKGKPGSSFWIMAGPEGIELYMDAGKVAAAQAKAKELGLNTHAIPLKFASYEEKVEKVKDAKAGGVEVEVDNSIVVLERNDALSGSHRLGLSTPMRPQAIQWDVGEVRFFTPASGGREMGPFRLGQIFSYEGKDFALVGREDKKIHLRDISDPEKKAFWVPPELEVPRTSVAP